MMVIQYKLAEKFTSYYNIIETIQIYETLWLSGHNYKHLNNTINTKENGFIYHIYDC